MFQPSSLFLEAREKGIPVIAFESAIITHGLPYPENIGLLNEVMEIAGSYGVYPAVFWLADGFVKIGFEKEELSLLASQNERVKISCRDIPYVLANNLTGGTTVAATIFLAQQAGLEVFATGGLGGVHFQAEKSFDISHDLFILSKTPIIVVSSGAKAILDIPKTLELLETLGVPLFGYRTDSFPVFYTSSSIFPVRRIDNPAQIRDLFRIQRNAGLDSALIIANPVPAEWSIAEKDLDMTIKKAFREAEENHITGQEVTPFLLKRLSCSGLGTVKTNIELVKNNVRLACEIALELNKQD